jgi:hypothetical protein
VTDFDAATIDFDAQEFEDAQAGPTEAELSQLDLRIGNLQWYGEFAPMMISDKRKRLMPYTMKPLQRYTHYAACEMEAAGLPLRMLIAKARQQGQTTHWTGRNAHRMSILERRAVYFILHDLGPAKTAYQRFWRIFTHVDPDLRIPIVSYKKNEYIKLATESELWIESANKQGTGRSETLTDVHGTELPDWPDVESTMNGIEESVPLIPGTSIVLETTSQGPGDFWHHMVKKAMAGKGMYRLLFLPWYFDEDYELPVNRLELRANPWSPEEEALGKRILAHLPHLSVETVERKLWWRRLKLESKSWELFCQEYPATIEEQFRATGKTVFSKQAMAWHDGRDEAPGTKDGLLIVRPAEFRYQLQKMGTRRVDGRDKQLWGKVEDEGGNLHVWVPPKKDGKYVIAGDIASGEAEDRSAAQVLRIEGRWRFQEAVWHGHIGTKAFAYVMAWLGWWYNKALLVPERNNEGAVTVAELVDVIRYGNIFRERHRDVTNNRQSIRYGIFTDSHTRPQIIGEVDSWLRDEHLVLRHHETLEELQSFRWHKNKTSGVVRAQAAGNAHDDLVIPLGAALWAAGQTPILGTKQTVVSKGPQYTTAVGGDTMPSRRSTVVLGGGMDRGL